MKNRLLSLRFILSICLISSFTLSTAQQTITQEDYQRAVSLTWNNTQNKKVFNTFISPQWFSDHKGLWFTSQSAERKQYMKVSFAKMEQTPLFDHEALAKSLAEETGDTIEANSLSLQRLKYEAKDDLQFYHKTQQYSWNPQTNTLSPIAEKERPQVNRLESTSPDSSWVAFSKDYNLYLRSSKTGEEKQLSFDGEKLYEYASTYAWADIMEGEGGERPERFYVNWSPDGKYVQAYICDMRTANKMYLLDWSVDSLYRPKLLSYYRGSPGDTGMVYMHPIIFEVETGKQIPLSFPKLTHINNASFRWSSNPDFVYASYAERGYQKEHIIRIDLKEKQQTTLYTEESKTNIDNSRYWLMEKQEKLLLASERSGWRQLYTFDLNTKTVEPLTQGEFYVNNVQHIDEDKGKVYYTASGVNPSMNPYYEHLYSVDLKKKKVNRLTEENAHHVISFSPDKKYFFDNFGHANHPTQSVLRETKTGKIAKEVSKADISALEDLGWEAPQIFEAIGRDEKTTIYGAIWKPTNFDPNKTYPVIDATYTGPHTKRFPTRFDRIFGNNQALAELGFVVLVVDGLGSSGRSKAFHDYSYKNLGGNLADHVRAIRQLGERYEWIDTTRVGIFGHSAGGYDAAHALLAFPDFYKVGVASSADHDHRMEKAWWPEMYMGWPVDSAYHLQSNITMAANLKGKLLITHGGIDENVNPSATFKLAEALVQADKEFDLLIFPSQRHGYGGKTGQYFIKKRWNYFVEHLLEAEPIWEIEWE